LTYYVAVLSLFTPTRAALAAVYPDLKPLRRAVKAGDWASVSEYFRQFPRGFDASFAVTMVAEIPGSQKWLQLMADTHRDDPLPRLLLGGRLIAIAWKVRSGYQARYVGQAQFALFHTYLYRADRLLGEVTADEPGNIAAWTLRLDTARGLGFGLGEARRRYERVAAECKSPFHAQRKMVQQLCPKWGGTFQAVEIFTRDCLAQTPPGGICGAVVAEHYLEAALEQNSFDHFRQDAARQAMAQASALILHQDYQPQHGWATAHGLLAAGFWLGHNKEAAKPHFAVLNNKLSWYPWAMIDRSEHAAFRKARYAVLGR
jgi:hypothetical protein